MNRQTPDQGWQELQAHIECFFDQVCRAERERDTLSSNAIGGHSEYLVIETSHSDAEIAIFDLNEHGIVNKIRIARDAFEAMDYLFGEDCSLRIVPPKAIFLDLHMPKISGLDFLRRIKTDEHTKGIPVVVLRSSISPIEVNECQQFGVNEFLPKPFQYDDFINIIKKL